ncbi:MAG TPA: hypothetical protein GX005_09950 [Bacteroidales bacterium]|nr:hypothetical protein [Bacteroidales bacterium]
MKTNRIKTIVIYEIVFSDEVEFSILGYSYFKPTKKDIESIQRYKDNNMNIDNVVIREYWISNGDMKSLNLDYTRIYDVKKYFEIESLDSVNQYIIL